MARKRTFGTRTNLTTSVTDLGCVVRLDSNNNNSFSNGFVLDEALQLVETPITNPIVHNLSSSLFSDTFKVFHYNLVSVEIGNNVFTDVMINPSHPTSFSSREFSKKPLTGMSAYSLQFRTQMFELSFDLFDFSRIIKPVVRADSEVIYSEVNAQNNSLRTTVLLSGSNLFRECEQEKASPFFIHPKQAFFDIPSEVFFITSRNVELELLPTFKQPQNQSIPFEICTSWEIVSDRSSIDNWLRFSLLDHTTSLSHTSDSYLCREFKFFPNCVIDCVMQFEVLSDFMLPSIIDTELKSFSVSLDSSNYFFCWLNSDFRSDSCSHNNQNISCIYKCYASPPTAKAMGIRSEGAL